MQGFLPPISAMQGRGYFPVAIAPRMVRPTPTEPVNVTPAVRAIRNQRLADGMAGARDVIEDAGRQSGIADAVGEQAPRPGRVGGAFHDDRVAGDHRGRRGPAGQREREIEGRDDGPDAVRAQHASVARHETLERVIRKFDFVALVRLEVIRIAAEEIHRLLRLARAPPGGPCRPRARARRRCRRPAPP